MFIVFPCISFYLLFFVCSFQFFYLNHGRRGKPSYDKLWFNQSLCWRSIFPEYQRCHRATFQSWISGQYILPPWYLWTGNKQSAATSANHCSHIGSVLVRSTYNFYSNYFQPILNKFGLIIKWAHSGIHCAAQVLTVIVAMNAAPHSVR